MTLREQQSLFVKLVGKFIEWCEMNGYELTFGECYRTPEQAEWNAQHGLGIANSLHTNRLAIDLNLFVKGQLVTDVASYKPLGECWKSFHQLCRHGGDFSKPDVYHFSMEWGGVK